MIEDKLLILRFRRGRPEALRQIYDKYKVELLRYAMTLVGNLHTAEDIVHDVFVSFAQSADRIGLTGSLKGYLVTSVLNRVRNHVRDGSRRGEGPPMLFGDGHEADVRERFPLMALRLLLGPLAIERVTFARNEWTVLLSSGPAPGWIVTVEPFGGRVVQVVRAGGGQ